MQQGPCLQQGGSKIDSFSDSFQKIFLRKALFSEPVKWYFFAKWKNLTMLDLNLIFVTSHNELKDNIYGQVYS